MLLNILKKAHLKKALPNLAKLAVALVIGYLYGFSSAFHGHVESFGERVVVVLDSVAERFGGWEALVITAGALIEIFRTGGRKSK